MVTVQQIADDALKLIMVQGADAPAQPEDYSDFINLMNDWFAAIEVTGRNLGYTRVSNIADLVTIPDGAVMGAKYNLAILANGSYGGQVTPDIISGAEIGMQAIRKLCVSNVPTRLPSTLPTGNGNWNNWDRNFHPGVPE